VRLLKQEEAMITICAAVGAQVIFELQQQLAGAQQHGQELAATIEQLEDVLAPMKEKLKGYKHRWGLRPGLNVPHDLSRAKGTGVVCAFTAGPTAHAPVFAGSMPWSWCCLCRCSELEGKRLQDAEHLMAANTELSKVKELYWSKKGEAVSSSNENMLA
jgi:hypothetical protein